ncbi:MAG: circadian clock protein KaiA [Cyanophyceae cyanobacterium]
MSSLLSVTIFSPVLVETIQKLLNKERYRLYSVHSVDELVAKCANFSENIDCLIVCRRAAILAVFNQLYEQGILLPVVIIQSDSSPEDDGKPNYQAATPTYLYHSSEVHLAATEIASIAAALDRAIAQFLRLGTSCALDSKQEVEPASPPSADQPTTLQQRLAQKLRERLGYLGVYYQRNPEKFYCNLSPQAKQEFLRTLRSQYQEIILNYFVQDQPTEPLIDQFVNQAFLSDLSVSQVLEIHMELMQQFSQQLKLEGRSEEILLDYRLTLIDVIAHLGEMYRRSVPRESLLQLISET